MAHLFRHVSFWDNVHLFSLKHFPQKVGGWAAVYFPHFKAPTHTTSALKCDRPNPKPVETHGPLGKNAHLQLRWIQVVVVANM
jgi:hypothetical protein